MTLIKTIKVLVIMSAVLESWAGIYLTYDQADDLVGSFTGFFVTVLGILIVSGVIANSLALLALLQVFLASFELVLGLLIGISLYSRMNDQLLIALYFSSLLFLILQSILLREYVNLNYTSSDGRHGYQEFDPSV